MKRFLMLMLAISLFTVVYAQEDSYKTYTYFENDTTKLELDLFLPAFATEKAPLIIYVHGGGFSGGSRESGRKFCAEMANNGVAAATISYTLYMKGKSFSCDGILTEKVRAFQIAANQFWQATAFFIQHQNDFNIDIAKIFMAGSSAGAETILHAAYWDKKQMGIYPLNLPTNFKYAGLISGAGAFVDINLITTKSQIPGLFFHGTCDNLVPYNIAPHHYCTGNVPGWLMLFGGKAVFDRLCSLNGKAFLITYCGGGHECAGKPFDEEIDNILWFIKHAIMDEKFQIHSVIPTAKSCERSAEYDYCNQ